MTRVRLAIVRGPHRASLDAGHHVVATRLLTKISFARAHGWTDFESVVIVDTGAPLSLFPKSMWQAIDRQVLASVPVGGLTDKPECRISADLAIVNCILSDGATTIGPYRMTALLSHTDGVPALLGLSGPLENADLTMSLRQSQAFIETA